MIRYSGNIDEFATGHGQKRNMIGIWSGVDGEKVTLLEGHKSRVLNLEISEDG